MPTQNTDINGVPYGISFTMPGEKWTVAKDVTVTGTVAAVYSPYANSTLVNKGELESAQYGVLFDAGGAPGDFTVKNKGSGEIGGTYALIIVDFVGSAHVKNDGEIGGSQLGIITSGYSNVHIENTKGGEISGGDVGIYVTYASGSRGVQIDNDGDIEGVDVGIFVAGNTGFAAEVYNGPKGVIESNGYSILSVDPLDLNNKGKLEGTVFTLDGDDNIVNKGKIKGDVYLSGGDDVFKNKGKAKADLIDTQDGNDKVVFGDKKDKLLFDSALNSMTNVDRLKKFESGKDKLYLDDDIFSTITPGKVTSAEFHKGTAAVDADDRIIYDKKSGALYYDPDGTGVLAQTEFAHLDKGAKLKASDLTAGEFSIILPIV
jgi:Ca2+-binding RTX toxin-like protein